MAVFHKTAEEVAFEREEEQREHERVVAADKRAKEHAFRLAKLKLVNQPRSKAWQRMLIAAVKAPALVVLAITIPVLIALDKSVPAQLLDFLTL